MAKPTLRELRDQARMWHDAAQKGLWSKAFARQNIERIEREMELVEKRERQRALLGGWASSPASA